MGSDGFLHTLSSSKRCRSDTAGAFPSAQCERVAASSSSTASSTRDVGGMRRGAERGLGDRSRRQRTKVTSWKTGGAISRARPASPLARTALSTSRSASRSGWRREHLMPTRSSPRPQDAAAQRLVHRRAAVDFNASPIVFRYKDRDLVAATGNDGRLYLLDGASLGGADHKTPLHVTPKYFGGASAAGLATWEGQGTRWILAPVAGAAAAGATVRAPHGVAPAGSIVALQARAGRRP